MNQKEKEILKVEENFKDTLENELAKNQTENKKIYIKDIKLVGEATWQDKINNKPLSDNVFIVDIEMKETDREGKIRTTEQRSYYLGSKCIAGTIGDNKIAYNQTFANSEPDKMKAIKDLLNKTSEQEIESNSMNKLKTKEIANVLAEHLGRKVSEEEASILLEEMDKDEIEEFRKKDKDKNNLFKKQTDRIKVNGVQKADLNKKVDGKETLGKRLDLEQYESLYVVYSDKVDEISAKTKKNNTIYSLVGVKKDGEARILNDEFDMDKTVGNNANRESTKIRADGTATRDNKDISVYTRKSNGVSIGCENRQGEVKMFFYQKTKEENENVGIQIETYKTPVIPIQTREVFNRNKGIEQKDKVQDEIEEHTEKECNPKQVEDYDGIEETSTHEHLSEEYIDKIVMEIYNYENDNGEEKIKEIFTEKEIKDKLLRELKKDKNNTSFEQVVIKVKEEMNQDAEILSRERKI